MTAAGSRCDSCCSCGSYCSAAGCRTIQYQVQGRTGLEKVKLKMQMVKNKTGLNIMFTTNVDYRHSGVSRYDLYGAWRLRCATVERRESASLLQCPIHPWRCSGELTAVVQWGESCSHGHTAVNQTYYLVTRTPRRWCFNHCYVPVTIQFFTIQVSTKLVKLQMLNKLAVSFNPKSHMSTLWETVEHWRCWLFAYAN